jgi:hypothetical protein
LPVARRYPPRRDLLHHVRERYSSFFAHTGSCVRPNPSLRLRFSLFQRVFAGCRQSLLGDGPSRRYLRNPYVGAWTRTPQCFSDAFARFFSENNGLTSVRTSSAHRTSPAMQLQRGTAFSGLQSFLYVQAPTFARPPGCTYRYGSYLVNLVASSNRPLSFKHPGGCPNKIFTEQPGRLHHAMNTGLPLVSRGIATYSTRATNTAGLTPAGLRPCRPLPRTKAVRLITSALPPTGGSVSFAHHEHHSLEQLRFRQLYPYWVKGLLSTSTVRVFSVRFPARHISFSAFRLPECLRSSACHTPTMPSAESCTAVRVDCSTLSHIETT